MTLASAKSGQPPTHPRTQRAPDLKEDSRRVRMEVWRRGVYSGSTVIGSPRLTRSGLLMEVVLMSRGCTIQPARGGPLPTPKSVRFATSGRGLDIPRQSRGNSRCAPPPKKGGEMLRQRSRVLAFTEWMLGHPEVRDATPGMNETVTEASSAEPYTSRRSTWPHGYPACRAPRRCVGNPIADSRWTSRG